MPNRREFVKQVAGATAGALLGGRGLADARARFLQAGGAAPKRREISIGGRRVKTIDLHCHCVVPEVTEVVKSSPLANPFKALVGNGALVLGPDRIAAMDERGIDVEAVSINAFWYSADRALARDIIRVQNEGSRSGAPRTRTASSGSRPVALQYPDLGPAARRSGEEARLKGVAIGEASKAKSCRPAGSSRSGPKSRNWASSRSCTRSPRPTTTNRRLLGRGAGQRIGNPPRDDRVPLAPDFRRHASIAFPAQDLRGSRGRLSGPYSGRSDATCGGAQARTAGLKKPSE